MSELQLILQRLNNVVLISQDLVQAKYSRTHPFSGFCYIMTEAVYHLWGEQNDFRPALINTVEGTHWFLVRGNEVLDPTACQFECLPDYSKKVKRGFLTRQPCKRTRTLMERAGLL